MRAAERLCGSIAGSELVPVVKAMKKKEFSHPAERAGFVFPLYYLSFPRIVMDFIERYDFTGKKYIFIVATRGSKGMGGVIGHMREILGRKGAKLSAGFYIDMPGNDLTWLVGVPGSSKQKKLFDSARIKLDKIARTVEAVKSRYNPELFGFMRNVRHAVYLEGLEEGWKQFRYDENCTGCGICGKVCPVGNITMEDGRPSWGRTCQLCEGCLNFCPEEAVQFGDKTAGRTRYHNPECGWKDIILQKAD